MATMQAEQNKNPMDQELLSSLITTDADVTRLCYVIVQIGKQSALHTPWKSHQNIRNGTKEHSSKAAQEQSVRLARVYWSLNDNLEKQTYSAAKKYDNLNKKDALLSRTTTINLITQQHSSALQVLLHRVSSKSSKDKSNRTFRICILLRSSAVGK